MQENRCHRLYVALRKYFELIKKNIRVCTVTVLESNTLKHINVTSTTFGQFSALATLPVSIVITPTEGASNTLLHVNIN